VLPGFQWSLDGERNHPLRQNVVVVPLPEITIHRWLWTAPNLQLIFQVPLSVVLELGSLDGWEAAQDTEKGVILVGKMFIVNVIRHCQLLFGVATRLASPPFPADGGIIRKNHYIIRK
jgi:hypothetical protein